jgi:hypothetical protein
VPRLTPDPLGKDPLSSELRYIYPLFEPNCLDGCRVQILSSATRNHLRPNRKFRDYRGYVCLWLWIGLITLYVIPQLRRSYQLLNSGFAAILHLTPANSLTCPLPHLWNPLLITCFLHGKYGRVPQTISSTNAKWDGPGSTGERCL